MIHLVSACGSVVLAQSTGAPAGPVEVAGVPGAAPAGPTNGATGSPAAPIQPAQPGGLGFTPIIIMLLFVVGMFWLMSSSQRKEQRKLDELRKGLSRHDKVQTSGGIIGTVVEIGEQDVLLRVDEATNTRIRFAKTAIIHVLNKTPGAGSTAETKPAATVNA